MRNGAERPGRRDIRKRRFIPSFGDIILPVVGGLAVVLLFIAGKLFFVNGLVSGAGTPRREAPPIQEEVPEPQPLPPEEEPAAPGPYSLPGEPEPGGADPELQVTATPLDEGMPTSEGPAPSTGTSQQRAPAKPQPAAQKKSDPAPVWRVQVGAYNTKAGANEIVSKLAKSGYKATVFSGPKFHKVWVQAGSSKQAAEAVAARLKKAGFPGSYVVPPATRR